MQENGQAIGASGGQDDVATVTENVNWISADLHLYVGRTDRQAAATERTGGGNGRGRAAATHVGDYHRVGIGWIGRGGLQQEADRVAGRRAGGGAHTIDEHRFAAVGGIEDAQAVGVRARARVEQARAADERLALLRELALPILHLQVATGIEL